MADNLGSVETRMSDVMDVKRMFGVMYTVGRYNAEHFDNHMSCTLPIVHVHTLRFVLPLTPFMETFI